ncbi:hypothetical protein F0919_10205 [Taibaiella lutea]|uniref:Right handed beta helix domain-containing protein n=1 Tax=Taibaiella lutea TaxID=2608001 RepID=A0A5M6CLV3_9BACT|nr:hypothetical protein [Taibaiella lutea]KAA5534962.1 hypothetical protein F0919_10205 [Taibaiella lutea]
MQKKLTCIVASLMLSIGASAQIFTVNNNSNYAANFDNLQTAINTVPTGAVLLVQGSGTSYGTVVLDKQIVLLGPGYNLNQNPAPHTQADGLSASVADFTIKAGAAGAIISGMHFGTQVNFDTVNNILFQSNFCQLGIKLLRSNNNTINKCQIQNANTSGVIDIDYSTGITINNNLIEKSNYGYFIDVYNASSGSFPNLSSVTAEFNTLLWNNGTNSSSSTAFYCGSSSSTAQAELIVRNNIIANKLNSPATSDFATNVGGSYATISMTNNVMYDSSFNTTNGAVNNAAVTNLFQHWGSTAYAYDYICQDKAGSPALGAGVGGSNCGMYGGGSPYSISGLSIIPNISFIQMPTIGTTGYGIDVHIKAKANQ